VIRQLRGRFVDLQGDQALVEVAGVGYELTVSASLAELLRATKEGDEVTVVTHHYLHGNPQNLQPVLLGFATPAELDLFEYLVTVPGLGPKSAIRVFSLPVSRLARAVEMGDTKQLEAIPGLGRQKARDIISKLKGKLGAFLDVAEAPIPAEEPEEASMEADALEIMVSHLQLSRAEALARIQRALVAHPAVDDVEELIGYALRQ
jgi:Holliday junction DNA helicase RuvA